MKFKIITAVCLFNLAFICHAGAQLYKADFEQFKKNNADGNKYNFVKDYLLALDSIEKNGEKFDSWTEILAKENKGQSENIKGYTDYLKQSNIHFRLAKNLLNKYKKSENMLIIKSVMIFNEACNAVAKSNNEERKLLSEYYELIKGNVDEPYDQSKLFEEQQRIAFQRKEAFKMILESSLYVKKILISNVPNRYGEFVRLGVTEVESDQLIDTLNSFFGANGQAGMAVGQNFLEASVAEIREILEDYSWLSKDS